MPINYPYKTIHTFLVNFSNTYEYDLIKSIVLNTSEPRTKEEIKIKEYHCVLTRIFCDKTTDVLKIANIYRRYLSKNKSECFNNLIAKLNACSKKESCVLLDEIKNTFGDTKAGFILFALVVKRVSEEIKDFFVLPLTYFEDTKCINNLTTKKYYIQGMIERILENKNKMYRNDCLLEDIFEYYSTNKSTFNELGINHVYLFGSVAKKQNHKESDIDMVLEFNDLVSYFEILKTMDKIKETNYSIFKKDTDVYEYREFLEKNNTLQLLKIF